MPHDAFGGRTPAPRNDSADSSSMLLAMLSVKNTMIVDTMLGSNSENMIRNGPLPCATAASTNSFSRNARISPRIGLAM